MLTQDQLKSKLNELIAYAGDHLDMDGADKTYVLNLLLDFFRLSCPAEDNGGYGDFQTTIVDPIVRYAIDNRMIEEHEALLFETKLLGMVTPMPSAVISKFDALAAAQGAKAATDWLFELSKANNYVRMPDISKNIKWEHNGKFGKIGITINLSKPEKDPKQIALAKLQPKTGYPSCMLCPSNMGFAGHANHPARQTLRMIPIRLTNQAWHLQFSPYQYYDQHVIALSDEHRAMSVTPEAFARLMDFVDLFPHYFIGSNAALPIVGGSILTHDHYQGGNKVLPMFEAGERKSYVSAEYPDLKIDIAQWYNSVVRIGGKNREHVYAMACKVLKTWFGWTDESVGIYCKTTDQHNAITPIVRLDGDRYVFDLILRNNRTDEAHPYGIFHPEEALHNIKKEGIGIIEVMGLFILPGRLKTELKSVEDYLCGKPYDASELSQNEHPLKKHADMIARLIADYGNRQSPEDAHRIVTDYVNDACEKILECTGVFKNDSKGQAAFDRFMKEGLALSDK